MILPAFLSKTNLKLHDIPTTCKFKGCKIKSYICNSSLFKKRSLLERFEKCFLFHKKSYFFFNFVLFFFFLPNLFHSILKLENEIIMTWFTLRNWANVIFWITLKSFWIRTSIYFWKNISEQFSRQKGILLASCRSLLFFLKNVHIKELGSMKKWNYIFWDFW